MKNALMEVVQHSTPVLSRADACIILTVMIVGVLALLLSLIKFK